MGIFHCPMGAAFYDDDNCIDCGMCTAKTNEERVESSRKIREYLKSHAEKMKKITKIAVNGKGGTGKSTAVVLLANAFRAKGYSVLVLDTDESNTGLNQMLGFKEKPKALMSFVSGFSSGDESALSKTWLYQDRILPEDIPSEYVIKSDGIQYLSTGKIIDPFQGCACSLADLARDFVAKLEIKEMEILLIDTEAGIESFGRGVERSVDTVLVVIEPSLESLSIAEKIVYMAEGMGISRVRAILNKVGSEKVDTMMTGELNKRNIKKLGTIYLNTGISEASLTGDSLANQQAISDTEKIVDILLGESK